jgi:Flp pilus assembly protein TadD
MHPRALLSVLFFILIGAVIWMRRRTAPLQSFGLLWFFLLLIPSSMLVIFDRGEPMVEHRVYLASWGFFLALGDAADRLIQWIGPKRGVRRVVIPAAIGVAVFALSARTLVRNAFWANPTLVWLEAAERAPNHWLPQLLLAEELHRTGQHREAATLFQSVIKLRPQETAAYGKLGVCLSEQNDLNGAAGAFNRMKALDPASAEASNGLAVVELLRGHVDEARRGYLETLRLDQANIAARRGLAVLEETAGNNPAAALKWCEEIRALAADTPGNDECIRRNQARIAGNANGSR